MSELAVRENVTALAEFDPEQEVVWASRCAKALVSAIKANPSLTVKISNKDYIKAEGWQTLGAMTKVDHIEVVWCREYTPPNEDKHTGWEVRVEVRDREGNVRGTGEAMCIRSEQRWKTADEFAIRSMAQTRALGKAYRMALSYVVALAGYEPTPAEEMPAFVPEPTEQLPPVGKRPSAAQREAFEELLQRCQAAHPTNGNGEKYNWASMAERLCRDEFECGLAAITKENLAKLTERLETHLAGAEG